MSSVAEPLRRLRAAVLVSAALGSPGIGIAPAHAQPASIGIAPARAQPAAFGLPALTQMLASAGAGEATFTERREIAVLDRAQLSSGRLSFKPPDTFVRETLAPRRERLAVQGNTLTLEQGGRSRTMQLDSSPEASVLVEAIRGTLTGNRSALERHFEASVSGTPAQWAMRLLPRDARMRGQVAQVTVRGEQSVVREIDVLLADGDRSVMTIRPVAGRAPGPATSAPGGTGSAPTRR